MEIIEHLAVSQLFKGLPNVHLEGLASISIKKSYQKDESIFFEGRESTGFFIVISGRIKIYKISPEGKEQILHFFGPGEPFGEAPAFTGDPFPAYAEAIEDTDVIFLPKNEFVSLIKKDPSLALNMLVILSHRLQKFTNIIENLSLKEVPGRLAAYIIYSGGNENDASEFSLDISKGQLASLLGTIPETLSRILTKMVKQGLIDSDGRRFIKILDRKGLEELAEGKRRLG
ncbi:Crp/Fnr family transcriptional regulator [bacterium]|nr:Crp/Fnr family transcriptional regulator [bacterium]